MNLRFRWMKNSESEIYLVLNWNSKFSRQDINSEKASSKADLLEVETNPQIVITNWPLLMIVLLKVKFQRLKEFTSSKYLFRRLHVLVHRKVDFQETNSKRLSFEMLQKIIQNGWSLGLEVRIFDNLQLSPQDGIKLPKILLYKARRSRKALQRQLTIRINKQRFFTLSGLWDKSSE